jgi:WD40 repeat protein
MSLREYPGIEHTEQGDTSTKSFTSPHFVCACVRCCMKIQTVCRRKAGNEANDNPLQRTTANATELSARMENFDAVKDTLLITSAAHELHIRNGADASFPLLGTLVSDECVQYVNFSPDNTKLVGSITGMKHAVIWDLANLTEIARLELCANIIHACFSSNREAELVTSDHIQISIWNYVEARILRTIANERCDTFCRTLVDDCRITAPYSRDYHDGHTLKCWAYESGQENVRMRFKYKISQISQSPTDCNEIAVGFKGGVLALVNISTSAIKLEGKHHARDITGIQYSAGGDRLFSCSQTGSVIMLNTTNGITTAVVKFDCRVFEITLCPEETHVIVATWDDVAVCSIDSGEKVRTLEYEEGAVLCWSNRSSVILM